MVSTDLRFQPVVAVDVDGVLRVEPPEPGDVPEGVFSKRITIRREGYPAFLHREPEWDENDTWRSTHWLSGVGGQWVRTLIDRDIEVVWATTWQHAANWYFAKPLGLPELPVAVHGSGPRSFGSSMWKAVQLAEGFPGRPLLWVDDNLDARALTLLDEIRRPADRALTHFQWIQDWAAGIAAGDAERMDYWIDLASTPVGHEELRKERRRERDRARRRAMRSRWGTYERYRRWQSIRARLHRVIGSDDTVSRLLADYAIEHRELDPDEVSVLVHEWGTPDMPPLDVLLDIMRAARPS